MKTYTIVCGVDKAHLQQLLITYPTWIRHKPGLLEAPMLIFCDCDQVNIDDVHREIRHPYLQTIRWPPEKGVIWPGDAQDKYSDPQRYKMLAGFVYMAEYVKTDYILKLDTDVVANGVSNWIDTAWFVDSPAIVSHHWTFTKPADQMLLLDEWVKDCDELTPIFRDTAPLKLIPEKGSDRVGHRRVISWCGFFSTSFTRLCANMAAETCGMYKLPVPSQDGYLWYCAKRLGRVIERPNMKRRGWEQWLSTKNVRKAAQAAMRS